MSSWRSAALMRRSSAIFRASSRMTSQLSSSTCSSGISRVGRYGVVGTREHSTMNALTGASSTDWSSSWRVSRSRTRPRKWANNMEASHMPAMSHFMDTHASAARRILGKTILLHSWAPLAQAGQYLRCRAGRLGTIPAMSEAVTSSPAFVHLRVHSEFSVVDGIVRIPDLIKRVAKLGQPAVALTDLSNLFGLIKFYKGARGAGIKPIAGCDVWLTNDDDPDKPYRLLLLVRNHAGYLSLCELLTRSFLEN